MKIYIVLVDQDEFVLPAAFTFREPGAARRFMAIRSGSRLVEKWISIGNAL